VQGVQLHRTRCTQAEETSARAQRVQASARQEPSVSDARAMLDGDGQGRPAVAGAGLACT